MAVLNQHGIRSGHRSTCLTETYMSYRTEIQETAVSVTKASTTNLSLHSQSNYQVVMSTKCVHSVRGQAVPGARARGWCSLALPVVRSGRTAPGCALCRRQPGNSPGTAAPAAGDAPAARSEFLLENTNHPRTYLRPLYENKRVSNILPIPPAISPFFIFTSDFA